MSKLLWQIAGIGICLVLLMKIIVGMSPIWALLLLICILLIVIESTSKE